MDGLTQIRVGDTEALKGCAEGQGPKAIADGTQAVGNAGHVPNDTR